METLIALGVMTVLITGFLAVFGPAAGSIRKALTIDEINRMQATLERELGTLRPGEEVDGVTAPTSFDKAMSWIAHSDGVDKNKTIILYKYRGNPSESRTSPSGDETLEPFLEMTGKAGEDYVIVPMARRVDDPLLEDDLKVVEGRAFFVKMTQLVYDENGSMVLGESGKIVDPSANGGDDHTDKSDTYPEAVIAFQGSFYILPTVSYDYLSSDFDPSKFDKPAFTRNMAVRR